MKKTIIIILCFLITANVFADTTLENIELARINSVLNSVYPLIDAAQKQSDLNTRVKFHYDWLRQDIEEIQAGIAQKINNAPFLIPRTIKPLKNSFLTQQNSRTDGVFE